MESEFALSNSYRPATDKEQNMDTALREYELEPKLEANSTSQRSFLSWIANERLLYDVVSSDIEPDMPIFWGRAKSGTYFISSNVPESVRVPILQTECYRQTNHSSHATAAAFALSQLRRHRRDFRETLLTFYRALQDSFAEGEACGMKQDIEATITILTIPE